jgi:hypothetical protein
MTNKDLSERKKQVIEYIKNNPNSTYRDIRKHLKIHVERVFKEGMTEAYKDAGICAPRTLEFKNKERKRKLIIEFIRKNNYASSNQIKDELKINVPNVFESIKEAYKTADIVYPRKDSYMKSPDEKRRIILKLVKENPNITLTELIEKTKIKNPYRLFKDFNDIYIKAGIERKTPGEKIRSRKMNQIIDYLKKNPMATQREINKGCKTHVQKIFKKGILEAYDKAKVEYPFERRKVHGTVLKDIRNTAKNFEEEIATILSGYGNVNKFVKTKRGIADIILERKDKKIIIEIKDYQNKEISISQINQLNRYLEDCNLDTGILICNKKPKKDTFLIDKNRIFVLEKEELNKIPELIEGK